MPEAPILILLAPSAASPEATGIARGPDGDPVVLGLSLIQRTALAAHRAGYGQVFLLGSGDRNARDRRRRRLAQALPRRSPHSSRRR